LRSQDWSASWNLTNVTVTSAATTAPDGTLTASKIEATTSAATTINQNAAVAATSFSASIYIKKGSGATDANAFKVRNNTTATDLISITVNYDTGAITYVTGSSGATMTALADGWWRLTFVYSGITSGDGVRFFPAFIGGTETANEFCYLWGAQLEAAAFPSSYIPTTTASATRAADVLSVTGITGLNYPASLYTEAVFPVLNGAGLTGCYAQLDNGGTGDRILAYGAPGSNGGARIYHEAGSVNQALVLTGTLANNTVMKMVGRCATNSIQVAANGALATEDTSLSVPATPARVLFGRESASDTTALFGYLRRVAIWPRALTDAELQAVTR